MAREIPWDKVKNEFENTAKSGRLIAREFGISPGAIRRNALVEKWVKFDDSIVGDKELVGSGGGVSILKKIALRKIVEIRDELGDEYSSVDEPLIIMYAKNYEMWIELQLDIQEVGMISVNPKGSSYMSAEFLALKSVEKSIITIANQLGLSISSRKRLNISPQKDNSQSLFDLDTVMSEIAVEF